MPRSSKSDSLKTIAAQRADDYKWGFTWHASCSLLSLIVGFSQGRRNKNGKRNRHE